jgi:hypothetical protein
MDEIFKKSGISRPVVESYDRREEEEEEWRPNKGRMRRSTGSCDVIAFLRFLE